jgi:hypothetical protein
VKAMMDGGIYVIRKDGEMRLLINVLNISAVSYYYDMDDMVKVFTSGGEG